jgi:predicted metal-dependent phosphoesterase TrpH
LHRAGAVVFIAHPMQLRNDGGIADFIRMGLDGIEVFYPTQRDRVQDRYRRMARENGILMCGGSDYHGSYKDYVHLGCIKMPYEHAQAIKDAFAARQV